MYSVLEYTSKRFTITMTYDGHVLVLSNGYRKVCERNMK